MASQLTLQLEVLYPTTAVAFIVDQLLVKDPKPQSQEFPAQFVPCLLMIKSGAATIANITEMIR